MEMVWPRTPEEEEEEWAALRGVGMIPPSSLVWWA
jgi:hypothetical protein